MPQRDLTSNVYERLLRLLAAGGEEGAPLERLPPMVALMDLLRTSQRPLQRALERGVADGLLEVRRRWPIRVLPGAKERAAERLAALAMDPNTVVRLALPRLGPPREPFRDEYWQQVTDSIIVEARRRGVQAERVYWTMADQIEVAHRLPRRGFHAVVAMGFAMEFLPALEELVRMRFPVIMHNRWISWINVPAVMRDDYHTVQRLGEMFLQMGHRRMCMITGVLDEALLGGRGRIQSWFDFLRTHGLLEVCSPPVCYVNREAEGALASQVRHLFSGPSRPTALVFASGDLTGSVLSLPEMAHLAVPRDLSVATFDSAKAVPLRDGRPPLTEILLDMKRGAECILETVEKVLAGLAPPSIRMPLTIHRTESIGPAPQEG